MKTSQAIEQLYKKLPFLTDKFSDTVDISSVVFGDNLATVTTDSAHGLEKDDTCTILGLYAPINILSIERTNDKLLITTNGNHDITLGYQKTVTLSGSNEQEFNGSFSVLQVPSGTEIIVKTDDSGATNSTGSPFLEQKTGSVYNQITGYKKVVSAISPNTFAFAIESDFKASIQATGSVAVGFRITGAVTFETALQLYTRQADSKYWAFVIVGSCTASKDRKNNSDAIYVINGNSNYRQELNQDFSVFVFATATNEIEAYSIKDEMQDVGVSLVKSLVGAKFDNGFSASNYYANIFDNHLTHFYDKGIYAHNFIFQTTTQITLDDTYFPSSDVALREIDFKMSSVVSDLQIELSGNTETLDGKIKLPS